MAKKRPIKRAAAKKKKAAMRRPRAKTAALMSMVTRHITLDEHLEGIRTLAVAAAEAGEDAGACLVTDPHTGENSCVLTDRNTCKSLHGVFIGGPCGG